jgi:RNA polymerase sigma factor (sigma-70 family)
MFERIQHLSSAMAAGYPDAVDAFYRQYFDWMYAQARRVTGRDESFCLDVVQDAVLRVMRAVKPVDCENRFRGWLRLVVQTTAFDLLRAETRRKNREAMAVSLPSDVSSDSLQLDWLREQISQLDPELVNLIELRFVHSWSLRKIGEKTGLTIGAVDGRLRRALAHLKLAAEETSAPAGVPESSFSSRAKRILVVEAAAENSIEAIVAPFDVLELTELVDEAAAHDDRI